MEEKEMKINKGFKCFEMDTNGNLYALFIDKNTAMPVGEWINAGVHETKGFSFRPGFHIGEVPDCPWLKAYDGSDIGYYKGRRKGWKRVFAEVEYVANNDYTEIVKYMPKKCMMGQLPKNGFYFFRETGCDRIWVICDKMKINHILTEEERQKILKDMNYDEVKAFAPYKANFEKRMKKAV